MSWSDPGRRSLLLAGLAGLGLAGCGFAPAYGPYGGAAALRGAVTVDAPATLEGYRLRERLLDRLGTPTEARYVLGVEPTETSEQAAISADGVTTRYRLVGTADYLLRDAATGTELAAGTVDGFTGYSATLGTVASASAEEDARDRLAVLLAELILTRLIAAAPGLSAP